MAWNLEFGKWEKIIIIEEEILSRRIHVNIKKKKKKNREHYGTDMWLLPQKRVLAPKTIFHRKRFSMFDRLVFTFYHADWFHWKLWSICFIRPRIKIECLRFFCNFFCGVISWLWFINMVPFHVRSWNKWTELFNLDRDKIHNNGWWRNWY